MLTTSVSLMGTPNATAPPTVVDPYCEIASDPGSVVLFYAEGRPLIGDLDGRLRWHSLAGALEAYGVPAGDSGQLLTEPHVRMLAAQLAACMRRVAPELGA